MSLLFYGKKKRLGTSEFRDVVVVVGMTAMSAYVVQYGIVPLGFVNQWGRQVNGIFVKGEGKWVRVSPPSRRGGRADLTMSRYLKVIGAAGEVRHTVS